MSYLRRVSLALLLFVMLTLGSLYAHLASTVQAKPAANPAARGKDAPAPIAAGPSAAAYSFSGYMLITPTIDGVFSGDLVDGDGSATAGVGTPHPTKFVEQKKFDAADSVYYQDSDGNGYASAGDDYWIDGNGNGIYDGPPDDAVILGTPVLSGAGSLVDALAGETAIAYNDAEIDDNNRYDDGEDIYLVDGVGEFRGAMQRVILDPFNPGQVLAHIYIANNSDTVFMHNDFIVDAEATWIDGDGTTTASSGAQIEIGFSPVTNTISSTLSVQLFGHWFATGDDVYWKSTGPLTDTWSATGDALWLDANDDGVYSSTVDSVIVDTGTLNDGDTGRELNSDGPTPTYNFTYHDENANDSWDDGEDIATLDGDETYDWNYFDDRWSWLVDGDGDATDGRGAEDETRIDGNTWFQAGDSVYHWDADANGDWNGGDGLWIDENANATFDSGTDRVLIRGGMTGGESGKRLQVELVDGDGDASDGLGSENTARQGQSPFDFDDNVYWYDVWDDDNWFWSSGDGLWLDDDGDGAFTDGVDRVLVRGSMTGGETGVHLSASAHHFGYDDGEVDLNGRYDPGEDIYAANTYLAYDDLEIDFNGAYDSGEDIYDRDYIEIWVYAEGDAAQVPTDIYHPELEPGLRDVGFRVHVNGIRVDDPGDDYDAPTGFQAAAGWGYSRGAPTLAVPPGGYNRHYEYKLPSAAAGAPLHLVSSGERVNAPSPDAPRVWETDHKINWETCEITWVTHWKDIRRGRDNFQGFGSASGQREESIVIDWLHPPPPPPPEPPIVVKESLYGPIVVDPAYPAVENYCWSIFIYNPGPDDLGLIELRDHLPNGWNGGVVDVQTHPPGLPVEIVDDVAGPIIQLPNGLPAGGWVEVIVCANGSVEPTADEVINSVDGDMDTDGDNDLDTPIPGDSSSTPVITGPEVWLFKRPDKDEVLPGESVTWRIGVANVGEAAVNGAQLKDDVPDGLKVKIQSGTQPSGSDVTLPLNTLGQGDVRIVALETEVEATVAPSTTLTNTLTLEGEFSAPLFGSLVSFPYSTTVSASIHVSQPIECEVCITGRVTFTDCQRLNQPAGEAALQSVTVNIKRNGATVATVQTDEDGNYQYCLPVPPNPTDNYSVEVLLQEGGNKFRVRNGDGGAVPAAETPQFDLPVCPPNPRIVNKDVNFTDPANASNVPNNRRQDLAAIYKETEVAADRWENAHGVTLASPGPNVDGFSAAGTSYLPSGTAGTPGTIRINRNDSACTSARTNRPMNREWHEFNHYIDELLDGLPSYKPGDGNHRGFLNSESTDSVVEGWAEFWSSKIAISEGITNPHIYRLWGTGQSLEAAGNPKSTFVASDGNRYGREEWEVARLLWDLHDSNADSVRIKTVVTQPVTATVEMTYTDHISITNQKIYKIMTTHAVTTVKGLYDALKAEGVGSGDTDGDGSSDLDELFISHGFWGDDCDRILEPGEEVGWANQSAGANRPSSVQVAGAFLQLGVLKAGARVSDAVLHVEVSFLPPDDGQGLDYEFSQQLSSGQPMTYYFLLPITMPYTVQADLWVSKEGDTSDHLPIHNASYWAAVDPAKPYVLSHDFCLGGDAYDVNCDGVVDQADADAIAAEMGAAFPDLDYRPRYDLDGDGDVDHVDYTLILAALGQYNLYLPVIWRHSP